MTCDTTCWDLTGDRPAVAPAMPGLAVDPDDAARRRVARALPHQGGAVLVALPGQWLRPGGFRDR
jgi:hypothetical protein